MKKTSFVKKALSLSVVSVFVSSLVACGTPNASTDLNVDQINASSNRAANAKKWTIFVDVAADNNLYPFGLKDMSEMAYGLNSPDVNVVVLFDGAKTGDSAVYEIQHSAVKPAMNAPITSKKIANTGLIPASNEIDSGDPKILANFLDWGTKNYPADHYGVILWNHGSGIFRGKELLKPKNAKTTPLIHETGFLWDDHGGNMDIRDLGPILAPAIKNTGKKAEFVDFDACLMSHVEAAYQLKDLSNFLVASEKTEAGDGNDYLGIMQAVSANPNMTGSQFSAMMVDSYAKSYLPGGNQYTGRTEEYTLAATDTAQVAGGLTTAINALATELTKNPSSAKKAWQAATTYDGDAEPRDLGHFLTLLASDSGVSAAAKTLANNANVELKKAVIRETHTGKKTNALIDSTGLVIYLPGPGDSINPKYLSTAEIAFSANQPWIDFLKAFTKTAR
ncbi:MAG: hypothetical protein H7263_00230 [Candidatus Sericytochromatia bacterium]|nr:hypothetical protein [Candidatus Sericytochromatia bacterium]